MNRLVLGCGAVGLPFIERLADRPGTFLVLVDEGERTESLRESGVDTRHVDITDADDVRTVAGAVESVVVAPGDSGRLREVVRTARSAYPDAFVMACLDGSIDPTDRRAISEQVDRLVDLGDETGRGLLGLAGDQGIRPRKLREVLRGIDGKLAVVAHDNPDPDAIASAVGLERIAADAGVDAEACYYGEISHQENRALVNLLEFDLRNLSPDADLSEFDAFALVDHSRPGVNDGLSEDTPIDIVIDHHPPREPIQARFVDLRSEVGATCTLVAGYLSQFNIDPSEALASGLLYGIRTDTQVFSRGVSIDDFEAAARLVKSADSEVLRQIDSPNITTETLDTLGRAISNRTVREDILVTNVGPISDRDTLAQAADQLLDMKSIATTLVFGYTEETVFVSSRARGVDRDLGEVLREAFGQIGSAGGHAAMAGAQIPVGMLTEDIGEDERDDVIGEVISERFFEALGITTDYAAALVYSDLIGTDDEFDRSGPTGSE